MKIKALVGAALLGLSSLSLQAQQLNTDCGVSFADGQLIKQRLMENRRLVDPAEIAAFQQSRNIKYIPVKFHVVGDANGENTVPLTQVFAMLCDMNNDYRTQDVQFYMQGVTNSINFFNNSSVYNDGGAFGSQNIMFNNKSAGAINIFMSASVNNQVASYYTPSGDFVFVLNQMANGTSSTGTHEVGHFFTLNHTFYGWEGADVTAYEPGNAPNLINGVAVERAVRSGSSANCSSAADGFCDTPADYVSFRDNCPYTGGVKDPSGVAIDPMESNFMSYYADACVDSFTAEQKAAMAADILSRWNSFSAPTPNAVVSGAGLTAVTPANGGTVELNGDITLEWTAVPNATAYYVEVYRTFFGSPIAPVAIELVYGATSLTIPEADLGYPKDYSWTVRPINQLNTCGATSPTQSFSTTAPVSSVIGEEFNSMSEMRLMQNPLTGSTAELLINLPKDLVGSLQVYSLDGRKVAGLDKIQFFAGDNAQLLEVGQLSNGIYMVVLNTPYGNLQQKLVIQR
ncbi:zinc-dependent metalloprotease [Saprospira sp. CCB-QB6]|uniref:zinc-dependent metalloprotease n=1 Tax=Saprospira sp. CCB-QB6 TaxID=3023936 RepID=UPI00234BCA26|nr:zinc-dependent metalloprotease [Saprospira sp. CCB-QB6]WCL80011.1 zinc-dependent metalloprotease [Saprospira sp. CCB-QB6]